MGSGATYISLSSYAESPRSCEWKMEMRVPRLAASHHWLGRLPTGVPSLMTCPPQTALFGRHLSAISKGAGYRIFRVLGIAAARARKSFEVDQVPADLHWRKANGCRSAPRVIWSRVASCPTSAARFQCPASSHCMMIQPPILAMLELILLLQQRLHNSRVFRHPSTSGLASSRSYPIHVLRAHLPMNHAYTTVQCSRTKQMLFSFSCSPNQSRLPPRMNKSGHANQVAVSAKCHSPCRIPSNAMLPKETFHSSLCGIVDARRPYAASLTADQMRASSQCRPQWGPCHEL
jgi:hypothetical protein